MDNKFLSLPKKPISSQAGYKKLSDQAAKNVAKVLHIMLNDKK